MAHDNLTSLSNGMFIYNYRKYSKIGPSKMVEIFRTIKQNKWGNFVFVELFEKIEMLQD